MDRRLRMLALGMFAMGSSVGLAGQMVSVYALS
jgi:hypothetical protein